MKRYTLAVLVLLTASFAHSQVAIGFFAGPQATTSKYLINNEEQKTEFKYGFQAGMNMKIPFENRLFFTPAIFYSMKGYKVKYTQFLFPPSVTAVDNNTSMHTVELAALLQYDFGTGPGNFYIKVGPSLDFQLFGKESFRLMDGETVNRNIRYSYTEYGRYAANMLMQAGFETAGGLMIFGQYSHGMGSLNNADNGPKIKHRVYGLSIGHYLNRKKIVIDTRNRE